MLDISESMIRHVTGWTYSILIFVHPVGYHFFSICSHREQSRFGIYCLDRSNSWLSGFSILTRNGCRQASNGLGNYKPVGINHERSCDQLLGRIVQLSALAFSSQKRLQEGLGGQVYHELAIHIH